jgi:alpha-tubulin suppressor-like RCC1 family protein
MRKRLSLAVASFFALAFLACGDGSTGPEQFDPASVEGQITALFPEGAALRDAAIAQAKALRQKVAQNAKSDAQVQALSLVDFTLAAFRDGKLIGGTTPAVQSGVTRLVASIYSVAGLQAPTIPDGSLNADGAAKVIGPGGGAVVTKTGAAGVVIPPGTFSEPVLVTIEHLPTTPTPGSGPLPTNLKQYPPYYEYSTSPAIVEFANEVRVGICQVTDPASPLYPPEPHERLRIAHAVGSTIEILERVDVSDFLACGNVTGIQSSQESSSAALAHGGLGGKTKKFSPFGAVDPLSGPVQTVEISAPTTNLTAGRFMNVTAVLKDATGNELPGRTVTWTSSDTTLATVSASGVTVPVVGVTPGGPVTITATSEGKSAVLTLTIPRAANAPNREPGRFAIITLGNFHGCGRTFCWGANTTGQLGDGTTAQRELPTNIQLPPNQTFFTISAYGRSSPDVSQTCGLIPAGAAYCWGAGQAIGDGTQTPRSVPTAVLMPQGITFKTISAGGSHICALSQAGNAYCWGLNNFGQLGTGNFGTTTRPFAVAMPPGVAFSEIRSGYFHTCAIATSGALYCWGANANGEIGNNGDPSTPVPAPVLVDMPGGSSVKSVVAGWLYTCAITTASQTYCWGLNASGRLGDGTTTERRTPVPVVMPAGVTFASIAVGNTHTCALATSGDAYCWGDNSATSQLAIPGGVGSLGDGTTTDRLVPTAVAMPFGVKFGTIAVGTNFSCALDGQGIRYCWGANNFGQRGDGTTTP